MIVRDRRPGQPTSSNLLILPDSELVSSGIPRVEFGQLMSGIEFQGVPIPPVGRQQFRRVGLQGWLHGAPCIGTTWPVGGRTTSPWETGYPPIVGRGTRHDSQFSTLHHEPLFPALLPDFARSQMLTLPQSPLPASCPLRADRLFGRCPRWCISPVLAQQHGVGKLVGTVVLGGRVAAGSDARSVRAPTPGARRRVHRTRLYTHPAGLRDP